jgi:hypothetical protein
VLLPGPDLGITSARKHAVERAFVDLRAGGAFWAYRAGPADFQEFEWAEAKFAPRVDRAAIFKELAPGTTLESLPSLLSEGR